SLWAWRRLLVPAAARPARCAPDISLTLLFSALYWPGVAGATSSLSPRERAWGEGRCAPATESAERPSLTGCFPAPPQWRRRGPTGLGTKPLTLTLSRRERGHEAMFKPEKAT